MKNILILINVRWWNATAFYAINAARVLHKKGYNIFIGSKSDSPPYKKAVEYGLNVVDINFESYNLFKLTKNFLKMLKFLTQHSIEILNAHRSEDHTFAALAKLFLPVKFILTRGDRRKIRTNIFSRMIYNSADAIILTAKSIFEQNRKFLLPFEGKIKIIYGSSDEDHFRVTKRKLETRKKYRISPKNKIVGIAGRLDYVKDQYTFVKAAALVYKKYKRVSFIIAGKEEHIKASELKQIAVVDGVADRLTILPLIDDIADVVNLFDIAVITSVGSETISRTVLEYLYLGKPVIGTDVNVIPEIVKHNYNGIIINPKEPQALANAILRILNFEPKLKRMSKNSKVLYNKYYSEKIFYQNLKECIFSIHC